MKITRDESFKPFTISIKVETEMELYMLRIMMLLDVSLPPLIGAAMAQGSAGPETVKDFLLHLREVI